MCDNYTTWHASLASEIGENEIDLIAENELDKSAKFTVKGLSLADM